MADRSCEQCGASLEGRSSRARYCSSTCRARRAKGRPPLAESVVVDLVTPDAPSEGPVGSATRAALVAADRLGSPLGQACLVLAVRLDNSARETGSALASVARQLESMLASATRGAVAATSPQMLQDEVAERRRRRGA